MVKKFSIYYGTEHSLPPSKEPITRPFTERDVPAAYIFIGLTHFHIRSIYFISWPLVLCIMSRFLALSLPFRFEDYNSVRIYFSGACFIKVLLHYKKVNSVLRTFIVPVLSTSPWRSFLLLYKSAVGAIRPLLAVQLPKWCVCSGCEWLTR